MKRWPVIVATPIIVSLGALAYWYSLSGVIQVCYQLHTGASAITKVYWSAADEFAESRSVGARVAAGTTRVCLTHPDMRSVATLRIDPTDIAGDFDLRGIHVYRLDLLPPWRWLQRVSLDTARAAARQQVENTGPGRFESPANDPFFVWRLETPPAGHRIAALNLVTLLAAAGMVCLICLAPARQRARARLSPWPAVICLGFFVSCLAVAMLARSLNELWVRLDMALYLSVTLLAVYLLMFRAWGAGPRSALALVVLAGVLLSISLDAGYRFGWLDRPAFAKISHDAYHWRVTRRASDNLDNSSLRYYRDFQRLRTILRPRTYFVADLATSYYVNAALPVYPKVMQPHHGRYYAYYEDALMQLCSERPGDDFQRSLRSTINEDRLKTGSVPTYFFVNRDQVNDHIRNHCLTRNRARVAARLAAVGDRVFSGDYLDVYALDHSRLEHMDRTNADL